MGSLPVVLLLCSFHGNAAKQNTQIILFNYGWVAVCLFLCCKTLPSCGFCSTALTAVAQTQQAGNTLLLISHTLDQDDFCCTTSVHLWVIAMGYWEDVFLIWSCFFFPPVVSRDRWGTWRHLANQWVTAYWKWPLNCPHKLPSQCSVCFISSLCRIHFQYVVHLLSPQTVGRRCILAPGCTRFTGPSRDVLVLFVSTGDLHFTCRMTYIS